VKIHSRDGDAIIATHGRGLWIIDDLSPLRALTPDALQKDVVMLTSRPAVLRIPRGEARSEGDAAFSAGATDDVASITYYLKKRHIVGESKIEIYDSAGKLVTTLQAGKRRGINRVDWAMRMRAPKMPTGSSIVMSGGAFFGPRAAAGTYTVKLIKGKETYTSTIELVPDERANYTADDRAVQQKTVRRLYDLLADFTFLTERVRTLRDAANNRASKLTGTDKKRLTDFASKLDSTYSALVSTREGGWLSGDEQLRERIAALYGAVNNYDGRPTTSQLAETEVVSNAFAAQASAFETQIKELDAINKLLTSKKAEPLTVLTRESWEKQDSGVVGGTSRSQLSSVRWSL